MFRTCALVLMCALLPRWALARDTDAPVRQEDAVAAPPLVSAPEEVEPEALEPGSVEPLVAHVREEKGVPAAPRILLETLSGGAGMVAGGLVGLVGGVLATECSLFETDCTAAALFALSGMTLGSALATWGAGILMNGRGGFFSTLVGALLGTGAGLVAISVDQDTLGPIGLLSLPAIGAMTGYELSQLGEVETTLSPALRKDRLPVTPAFGTTPRWGFMGGVAGSF